MWPPVFWDIFGVTWLQPSVFLGYFQNDLVVASCILEYLGVTKLWPLVYFTT